MNINGRNVTVIGITGTIGSGKSTVGKLLAQLGVPIIDTDKIVHELLDGDDEVKTLIKQHFPSAAESNDSNHGIQINRKQLAEIIFKDAKAKKQLESILHPRVRQISQQHTKEQADNPDKPKIIAVLVPLLFENQLQSQYDQTWVVVADNDILRQRLSKRDGLAPSAIDLRVAAQMSQEQKAKLADVVIDNSGDENELRQKVSHLVENLLSAGKQKPC